MLFSRLALLFASVAILGTCVSAQSAPPQAGSSTKEVQEGKAYLAKLTKAYEVAKAAYKKKPAPKSKEAYVVAATP